MDSIIHSNSFGSNSSFNLNSVSPMMTSPEEPKFVFDSPVIETWLRTKMSLRKSSPLTSFDDSPFSMFKIKKKRNQVLSDSCSSDCFSEVVDTTPILKRRALADINNKEMPSRSASVQSPTVAKLAVQKSIQNPNLIGDFSKDCHLPVIKGTHSDIATISPDTVAGILREKRGSSYHIFDCRYPYEYDGGHILSAVNVYLTDDMKNLLFGDSLHAKDRSKVLILYCEFSSERAPSMYRYIRSTDRDLNKDTYPSLHYPEMYLVEGGYKAFFEDFREFCEPQEYMKMLDKSCSSKLKEFRAKRKVKKTKRCRRIS